ncbi:MULTISPECIES: glutamine synthetase family protein [unclassified Corallococcus]|uniref:glutamine synthetase family protein n=1 Tax=unclassified Corallococcus TaxID=2685029 RepID=UPI001A8EF3DE|nr:MULTISPECIES: glutamine synthetase family protein [unclassified Corallococcus]MBN9688373.1 glutamine synthetase [Corallococcus sp. NCSPR001]WAS87825.1 glutamine synthetase family protein [Corallococcus sp. NCRR]
MEQKPLRDFLEIPYDELEELNLKVKRQRIKRESPDKVREERIKYLTDEKRIKAVTVCFTDLEGRLHMLDYDKKFLLKSADNLTFDGSSIRGFSAQAESDLRLNVDWSAFYWLPSDIFGPGKVLAFCEVLERDGTPYHSDMRGQLKRATEQLFQKDGTVFHAAPEIEGFLFKNRDAERHYHEEGKFEFISIGGYYHALPGDGLRTFIDKAAEAQRAMGFENEKDHPEVAPSQFEMNFSYSEALVAADQIQLYKLLCRQVAAQQGLTASFLPKPVTGVNGNGMHINMSLSKGGKNLFYDKAGQDGLSSMGWEFIDRILTNANDICLVLNSSVNSYRRLDPHYEAPNQIKASANNRGAMVRIPFGNERSARVECRSVAPDANPYMVLFTLLKTGLEGPQPQEDAETKRSRTRFLPDNIYDAVRFFKGSQFVAQTLGEQVQSKYAELKVASADRCPKQLGTRVKDAEIQFHHEVTNQYLWNLF